VPTGTGSPLLARRTARCTEYAAALMSRTKGFGVAAGLALILIVSAAVVVTRALESPAQSSQQAAPEDENEGPPTVGDIAHPGERLAANGFEVSDELLTELAAKYGVGGAIRIVAWSEADPDRIADLRSMRDGDGTEGGGMGWGLIAKELKVHPGIGSIMGRGGDEHPQGNGEDR
jgi:hypothetical protein